MTQGAYITHGFWRHNTYLLKYLGVNTCTLLYNTMVWCMYKLDVIEAHCYSFRYQ